MANPATNPYPALTALPKAVWEAPCAGLAAVAYDATGKQLFLAFPHEHRIAQWSVDGTEVTPRWAECVGVSTLRCGAKGLVAAGDEGVSVFDTKTATATRAGSPAPTLSAVAMDSAGTLFAAEPAANRIWVGGPAGWRVLVEGPDYPHPHGLLTVANLLFVALAGTSTTPGRVAAINCKTNAVQWVTAKPAGALLGLDRDDKCYYITLDTAASNVLRISPVGEVGVLLPFAVATGPPTIIPDRRLLLLPRVDRLSAYSLDVLRK